MLQNLTGWHALVILAVVVLIFGAAKLPALAKSVGQSVNILKKEVAEPASTPPTSEQRATAVPVAPADGSPSTRPLAAVASAERETS
ncbi:twin-arginine translocase TatA/TatE family subunit [Microbacterium barkeri]|uniref:twin-arginine translocase TatA/TatE family subunit n=1 Tax=Microbacterium barkeri TaxID=33917 RepID=UPI0024AF5EE7|nr:twin-arginine translocase TatA/TatE family subunit [Microbacterium barkeri]MDI6942946.1 twin-arginine translocase TatA/TatE family subunit [Microbacterium barkeri]